MAKLYLIFMIGLSWTLQSVEGRCKGKGKDYCQDIQFDILINMMENQKLGLTLKFLNIEVHVR